jgi:hypothetical protein
MKIRNGFVSNSSSSSFCIYGVSLETDYVDILKKIKKNSPESFKKVKEYAERYKGDEGYEEIDVNTDEGLEQLAEDDPIEMLDKVLNNKKIDDWDDKPGDLAIHDPEDGGIYIGIEWKDIGDDETGKQFKARIEAQLKKILGKVKCETHEMAWRDG